jgi:hypothetical protein
MHYLEYRVPSALEQIQRILATPVKKTDTRLVRHLTALEMQAILDAPDPTVACRYGKKRHPRFVHGYLYAVKSGFQNCSSNARNDAMTRAGFEYILRKHVHTAETATKDLRKVSL